MCYLTVNSPTVEEAKTLGVKGPFHQKSSTILLHLAMKKLLNNHLKYKLSNEY
jgi:hypothetical protein